jgi:hypothetical protein
MSDGVCSVYWKWFDPCPYEIVTETRYAFVTLPAVSGSHSRIKKP